MIYYNGVDILIKDGDAFTEYNKLFLYLIISDNYELFKLFREDLKFYIKYYLELEYLSPSTYRIVLRNLTYGRSILAVNTNTEFTHKILKKYFNDEKILYLHK